MNEGYTIKPNSYGGFGYMWGGVRANYGVTDGKVAFQMKVFVLLILGVLDFFEH